MALHRELFTKLAPAEEIRRGNRDFLNNEMEADGFYIIVQDIARKYGDRAYEIAEKVFAENGMSYDPKELRTPGAVRRVGYVFEGANVYNIKVADYKPEMIKDLLWLYNREIRNVSRECFMDEESFKQRIASGKEEVEGLFLAYNEGRQRVGFIHCHIGDNGEGSVEAMFFLAGRIHRPVEDALAARARDFFAARGVKKVSLLAGCTQYPFYGKGYGNVPEVFKDKLPHVYHALQRISDGNAGYAAHGVPQI